MARFSDRAFCSALFVTIERHGLLASSQRLLLAVSGGLDSMVLLDFFRRFGAKKYGLGVAVAHLDHALRPESAADAAWLADFCHAQALPFFQTRIPVHSYHQTSSQSSLEAVARELRYAWLIETAHKQGFDTLATAHTASDQAEGLLMRWVRGTVQGRAGMLPRQNRQGIQLIRPLLEMARTDLEAYANWHRLSWREDSSNQDLRFFRNRLRAKVLPLLRAENPHLDVQWAQQALLWQEENELLEQLAAGARSKIQGSMAEGLSLELQGLQAQHPALRRRIFKQVLTELCGDWRIFSRRHVEALNALLTSAPGRILNFPRGVRIVRGRTALYFSLHAPKQL